MVGISEVCKHVDADVCSRKQIYMASMSAPNKWLPVHLVIAWDLVFKEPKLDKYNCNIVEVEEEAHSIKTAITVL